MIVLDTHAFLWWRDEDSRLSAAARTAIEGADRIGVPTACCLEIATLDRRGRITLAGGATRWIRAALADPRVEELPLDRRDRDRGGRATRDVSRRPGRPGRLRDLARNRLVTRHARSTHHGPRSAPRRLVGRRCWIVSARDSATQLVGIRNGRLARRRSHARRAASQASSSSSVSTMAMSPYDHAIQGYEGWAPATACRSGC